MKKYVITVLLLTILDISLCLYLKNLYLSLKTFEFKYDKKSIIYQKKDIVLKDVSEFVFDDYFGVLDFSNQSYKTYLDEDNKQIEIKTKDSNNLLVFNYELIEPEVIIQKEYITETVYVSDDSKNQETEDEFIDYQDNNIYYTNDYYEFALGTDISSIIQVVQDDVVSYTNVTCDYSCLNPYKLGEYSIYFYNDYQKITKKVKII